MKDYDKWARVRDSSAGKVLAVQAWEPKFGPQTQWWEERTDTWNLPSDFHTRPKALTCPPSHTYKNDKQVLNLKNIMWPGSGGTCL